MIHNLEISNFKSVKSLSLPCRKVNVFIGAPNSGKSNILEALGLISFASYGTPQSDFPVHQFVRMETLSNLFYDDDLGLKVHVAADSTLMDLTFNNSSYAMAVQADGRKSPTYIGDHAGLNRSNKDKDPTLAAFRYYRFVPLESYGGKEGAFLLPPSGTNLFNMLLVNKELRSVAGQLFTPYGLRLVLRVQESKVEIQKTVDDVIVSYPYAVTSDTLRRMVFYLAAIIPSRDSVLILEEPDLHAFPAYVKQMAEIIALDEHNNQFFLSTHNPYFLLPLLEKCPADDLSINIVKYENYETKVRQLTPDELAELGEIDIFSNLDRYEP